MNIFYLDSDAYQFSASPRALVGQITSKAESELRQLLPPLESHINLTIIPSKKVIPETGESATTPSTSWIQMRINPWDKRGIEQIISTRFRSTLFHECHHAARETKYPWGNDLIANAITEGLATAFERDNTDSVPPWGVYDEAVINDWTSELLLLDFEAANHQHYFFTHPDGRRWIAYRVGTYIVDQAIARNSGVSAASLVVEDANTILELAGLKRR